MLPTEFLWIVIWREIRGLVFWIRGLIVGEALRGLLRITLVL
jgi:hypothetical protein